MLIGTFFVALVITQALASSHSCGFFKRRCGEHASCVNRKCVCDPGFEGEPLMECHPRTQSQCVLLADPHFEAWQGATTNLPLPCRYRMADIETNLAQATSRSTCTFQVFGFNQLINGRYFVSGLEISLSIHDGLNHFFKQENIIKFDVNKRGVQTSGGEEAIWGHGVSNTWNGIEVNCKFNEEERFAILDIPRCGFTAKFRPYNEDRAGQPQNRVPGISVVVNKNTTYFGELERTRYPGSLCGQGGLDSPNESNLFEERRQELNLKFQYQALLHDALDQDIQQESYIDSATKFVLQDNKMCNAVKDEFAACPSPASKAQAINVCSYLLKKKSYARCMHLDVLKAFETCVGHICNAKDPGCSSLQALTQSNSCNLPRVVVKACRRP